MSYETLEYEVADGVARITLNRPDKLNALSVGLLTELLEALKTAETDDAVRAVLLAANGRAFSAGADLKEGFENSAEGGMDTGAALRAYYHPVIEKMRSLEKPIVAAVQGLAAGAGCSVALAADMVVAGASGSFQQIFTNIGLVPDAGSTYFMPHLIGQARALGAMLTGEAIEAERAERWGLIWQAVPNEALAQRAGELAATLARRPTRALGMTKTVLEASADNTLSEQLELEAGTQVQAQRTADALEAIQAFLNKRTPEFTGK